MGAQSERCSVSQENKVPDLRGNKNRELVTEDWESEEGGGVVSKIGPGVFTWPIPRALGLGGVVGEHRIQMLPCSAQWSTLLPSTGPCSLPAHPRETIPFCQSFTLRATVHR